MTEKRWLAAEHPYQMLIHPACRSPRKRRLWACACARRVFDFIGDAAVLSMIETSERFADGLATEADLKAALNRTVKHFKDHPADWAGCTKAGRFAIRAGYATIRKTFAQFKEVVDEAQDAMQGLITPDTPGAGSSLRIIGEMRRIDVLLKDRDWGGARAKEARAQCALIREIFGDPYHPSTIDPARLGPHTIALARSIYDDRDDSRLLALADALEADGVGDAGALAHARSGEAHVRGCWVVDAVLGLT